MNELEEFEHPYELENSSVKESKNESLKVKNNLENDKNNFNYQDNTLFGINNNYIYQNNPKEFKKSNNQNLINIQNNYNNKKDDMIMHIRKERNEINENYNNNFRLNNNIKKDIENLIETKKNNIKNNSIGSKGKIINKSKSKSKNKKINQNSNNIHAFSSVNDYWEIREKKNKKKMEKIKKEREQKIYGQIYPIPKINKNTQEIINRIKERDYDNNISIEDTIEDQINQNIPIKTKQKNNLFKNNILYSHKKNKSTTKIKIKKNYKLTNLNSNKKRARTPNPKKGKTGKKIINKNKNLEKISAADIKNIEFIKKLRKDEEEEKMKKLEEKIKLEQKELIANNYIEEKINEEDDEQSPEKIENIKNNKTNVITENISSREKKIDNYVNKSMNLISFRSKSNQSINQNINDIMTARRYLNDIYNKDKKIINHTFIKSSSYKNIPKTSNQRSIEIFYNNKSKSKSKAKSKQKKSKVSLKLNKSFNNLSLFDPTTKSLRYKHYTDGGAYSYTNSNINSNNISLNNINPNQNYNFINSQDKINQNVQYSNPYQSKILFNSKNNINNIDEDLKKKNNELYSLYNKEYNYKNNQINNILNEIEENKALNQNLLNEVKNINKSDKFQNIVLQNESINNIFNELDNDILLKYRQENIKKLYELNKKQSNKQSYLPISLQNQVEESKYMGNQINNDLYRKINSQKLNTILNSEQQKIENSLDYYNKELKINQKKKELLLNKLFGSDYTKNRIKTNYDKDNDDESNFINNIIDENSSFGINKYLIKDNDNKNYKIKDTYKTNRISNKYKFVYNPYKVVNGIKTEVEKDEIFNDENPTDIIGSFDFQRKHHFS